MSVGHGREPLSTVTRAACHRCKRTVAAYSPVIDGLTQPLRLVDHKRPDRPVLAWIKRWFPWTTEPTCQGSGELVRPVRWS